MNIPNHEVTPIALIHTPFKQKFAIPRQPRLACAAQGIIKFEQPFNNPDAIRDIEQFSHLWLLFLFSENLAKGWTPTIRPPRLGGNRKVGVFASRSTFRPNGIGMSAVELLEVRQTQTGPELIVGGVDLLDRTPVIDIKPYIPYSDSIAAADGGFAAESPPKRMEVAFDQQAEDFLRRSEQHYPQLRTLITQVLAQDPRPAYKQAHQDDKIYAAELYDLDIRWQVKGSQNLVISIIRQ